MICAVCGCELRRVYGVWVHVLSAQLVEALKYLPIHAPALKEGGR
jgi:hypothetical protein